MRQEQEYAADVKSQFRSTPVEEVTTLRRHHNEIGTTAVTNSIVTGSINSKLFISRKNSRGSGSVQTYGGKKRKSQPAKGGGALEYLSQHTQDPADQDKIRAFYKKGMASTTVGIGKSP